MRSQSGGGSVMVIDEANIVQPRIIQTGEAIGDKWIVIAGLKEGERVLIEGMPKAKPGSPVSPSPYQPGQSPAAATAPAKH